MKSNKSVKKKAYLENRKKHVKKKAKNSNRRPNSRAFLD